MLLSAQLIKRSLQEYCGENTDIPTISGNEWKILEKLIVLLETFSSSPKIELRLYCNVSCPTQHNCVGPFLIQNWRKRPTDTDNKSFSSGKLEDTFFCGRNINLDSKLHLISTALDPRYKTSFFKDVEVSEKAKGYIIQECMNMPSFEGEPPIGAEIPAKAPKSSLVMHGRNFE